MLLCTPAGTWRECGPRPHTLTTCFFLVTSATNRLLQDNAGTCFLSKACARAGAQEGQLAQWRSCSHPTRLALWSDLVMIYIALLHKRWSRM